MVILRQLGDEQIHALSAAIAIHIQRRGDSGMESSVAAIVATREQSGRSEFSARVCGSDRTLE